MTPEIIKDYELNFVEFDDQGWLHPAGIEENGDAYKQLDFLMDNLHQEMKKKDSPERSIILYIHGCKHNTGCKDGNVAQLIGHWDWTISLSGTEKRQRSESRRVQPASSWHDCGDFSAITTEMTANPILRIHQCVPTAKYGCC